MAASNDIPDREIIIDYDSGTSRPYSSTANSFVQVKGGAINFGNRDPSTGALNTVFTIKSYASGSYYGIACNANKIDIEGGAGLYDSMETSDYVILKAGTRYGATGILVAVTDVKLVVGEAISWTISKIPFRNGICVARR